MTIKNRAPQGAAKPQARQQQQSRPQGGPQHGQRNGGQPNNGQNRPKGPSKPAGNAPAAVNGKPAPAKAPQKLPTEVIVGDFITVRDLATLMERSPIDLIKVLMQYGIMAPITHNIDHDTAVILGEELNVAVRWPERTTEVVEEVEAQP